MDHLHKRLERLEQRTHTVERQLRWWRATALLLLVLGLVSLPWQVAHTQAQDEVDAHTQEEIDAHTQEEIDAQALTLEQRVAALEAKLNYLTTFLDASGVP
jgi:BMFP domain-containing protein YqiC